MLAGLGGRVLFRTEGPEAMQCPSQRRLPMTLALSLVLVLGCSSHDESSPSSEHSTGGESGATTEGASGASGFDGGSFQTAGTSGTAADLCGGDCACQNGLDDDGDGLVDGFDPECTSPFDNDEGTFATGIPGDNRDPTWQDCFFDGNSGAGDDGCRYHSECLTGERPASDASCTLTEACIEFCQPLTTNGCDCFGCCSVLLEDGTEVTILTGSSCSLADATDPSRCLPCEKTTLCDNTCGECELCPGKTLEDLPASCGTTPSCDDGLASCTTSNDCPADMYCSLGCCLAILR